MDSVLVTTSPNTDFWWQLFCLGPVLFFMGNSEMSISVFVMLILCLEKIHRSVRVSSKREMIDLGVERKLLHCLQRAQFFVPHFSVLLQFLLFAWLLVLRNKLNRVGDRQQPCPVDLCKRFCLIFNILTCSLKSYWFSVNARPPFLVIWPVKVSFCVVPTDGKSSCFKNISASSSLVRGGCVYSSL